MKKLSAELIGTFCLVFAGTGAIVINDASGGTVSHVGIAATFGLVVMAMIYTLGDISGAHLNPAVTLGFFAARRFSGSLVLPYCISQILGAVLASFCLFVLFPQHTTLGSTLPSGSILQSFILELILSFILMFVILSVSTGAKEKGITAGIAVGAKETRGVSEVIKSGKQFDCVITVCDESSAEQCPLFPGTATRLHWSLSDPSNFAGDWEERLEQTRRVRDSIEDRIREFCGSSPCRLGS